VAPHPDDEVFGCGGLIARTVAAGGEVAVVVLSRGERSHASCCDLSGEAIGQRRVALATEAAGHLSLRQERLIFLDWPDGQIGGSEPQEQDRRTKELAGWIARLRPEAVFAPHPFEGWADHEAAERMTRTAIERSGVACRLFHYCVWFWFSMPLRRALRIDWRKARVLDIADVYNRKRAAMDAYLEPCAPCGNPWSGVLPRELLRAFRWKKELFFEADGTGSEHLADDVEIEEKVATS
jgi:LmbE family N-acetylglucosaminyl deacetylase